MEILIAIGFVVFILFVISKFLEAYGKIVLLVAVVIFIFKTIKKNNIKRINKDRNNYYNNETKKRKSEVEELLSILD